MPRRPVRVPDPALARWRVVSARNVEPRIAMLVEVRAIAFTISLVIALVAMVSVSIFSKSVVLIVLVLGAPFVAAPLFALPRLVLAFI